MTGIQICEHLPKLAAMMDKLAVIRSIVGSRGPHFSEQCLSPRLDPGSPSLGAWVSRLEGPASETHDLTFMDLDTFLANF